MPVSAPDTNDLIVELADCINTLTQQQIALRDSLCALLPKMDGPWSAAFDGGARHDPTLLTATSPPRVWPLEPTPSTAVPQPTAEPVEVALAPEVRAPALKRNYDYFADLDARLAELSARDGEPGESA